MELSLLERRKLPLLFLLGVGIPSLALSVLALRGIQNELAVAEQRRLDVYRDLARRISDTLASEIARLESDVSRLTARGGPNHSSELLRELHRFGENRPLVEAAFFVEPSGEVRLPSGDLLFHAAGDVALPEPPRWPAPAAEALRAGQEEEFRNLRYEAAFSRYRTALERAAAPALEGEALLALTRVQRKAGRWTEALGDCETLLHQYGGLRTSSGILLGPVAGFERASLLLETGDSTAALSALVELYAGLVAGQWELARGEYDFLAGRVATAIQQFPSAQPVPVTGQISTREEAVKDSLGGVLRALETREGARRRRTERLLLLKETLERRLPTLLDQGPGAHPTLPVRMTLDAGNASFLVSLASDFGDANATEAGPRGSADAGLWGLLLDEQYAAQDLVRPVLETDLDPVITGWLVRGRDGKSMLSIPGGPIREPPTLTASLAGNFPPWLIEFYTRPQDPWRLFLASGQSIYLYMLLAIAIILGFGLLLTVRAVTRELELARMKSDFVSTVSHEFKSPLTSILQLSEMLQTGRVVSEARRRWYYDVLVEQSARLSALVNNVLDLARIDEGRKEFRSEPVDLGALVREVVTTASHRVGPEGFEVVCRVEEPLPRIRGDAEALRQAVSNLLDNAVRYSGDARQVEVRARGKDGGMILEVEDRGVGIPPEEIDKVFDRFHRGSGEATRSVRGSGLGLTLVKEIVNAHGGTVDVTSEVGRGSTFRITLPATTEASRD